MLAELYKRLDEIEALPKTWSPIKKMQRQTLKTEILRLIMKEIDKQIGEKA